MFDDVKGLSVASASFGKTTTFWLANVADTVLDT